VSEDPNKLRRQLERATAAEDSPDALDAETASLREGWLALGQLLEAAERESTEPFEWKRPPPRLRQNRWKLAGVAALAASLLIGLTVAWSLVRKGPPNGSTATPGEVTSPEEKESLPTPDLDEPKLAVDEPTLEDELDWDDDPLDRQLASVGEEIVRIQQDWDSVDNAFEPVWHGLEQMAEDIDGETL